MPESVCGGCSEWNYLIIFYIRENHFLGGDMSYPKVAVIGLGFMGRTHIQTLRRLGVSIHGIAGIDENEGRKVAGELGIQKWYTSFAEAIKDPEVEVVHLCTPNVLHYEQAKAALNAGNMCYAKNRLR